LKTGDYSVRYAAQFGLMSDIARGLCWVDAVEKGKNELTEIFSCVPVETDIS
jgi:hypothetical protein